MLPLDYSQALGRFKKIISLQQSRLIASSLFSCHSSFCAVLQDGWNISWTQTVLSFCCCCCCLFLRNHHSCFFTVWHNRKSIWQVGFTASPKTPCPLEANPLDRISKCCFKITHSHTAGVLRKKQPNRQESRQQPDPGKELWALSLQRGSRLEIRTSDRRGMRVSSTQSSPGWG